MKWNAELYDNKHAFVSQYGESVLELLAAKAGERILDLGCGTGDLANQLQGLGADVVGIDASPEMIATAKEKYPYIHFEIANAIDFDFDEPFDAVFSNAVLHWIKDADSVIKSVYNVLKPGGRFVAEMGGKGNMREMIAATGTILSKYGYNKAGQAHPWYFPSTADYAAELEAQGFRVTYTMHFDRPTLLQDGRQGVIKWLNMFGPSFFEGIQADKLTTILEEITDLLESDYEDNGQWYADYKRLRFIAVKE
ncbi:MAG TPA: methyltransferase domain-containing protein [Mucilaginibacter sp.]|nr:methyltransferase domain-containing protein [Mucilaginibacter sp.]